VDDRLKGWKRRPELYFKSSMNRKNVCHGIYFNNSADGQIAELNSKEVCQLFSLMIQIQTMLYFF